MHDKHTFFAKLEIHVDLSDEDFNHLLKQAEHHYDGKVKTSVELGGFLYGLKNRREFSEEADDKDTILTVDERDFQLMMKALEMDKSQRGQAMTKRFWTIVHDMQKKHTEINNMLCKDLTGKIITKETAHLLLFFLQKTLWKEAKLIGSIGRGANYSTHDIDILLPGMEDKKEELRSELKILFDASKVEDTDWGGLYFSGTPFGDIDIFFDTEGMDRMVFATGQSNHLNL